MSPVTPSESVVEVDGVRFRYLCWGDADKPRAVLLHGTGFVAETWRPFAEGLAARYRVLAFDRRGHGQSGKPGSYDPLDFAEDLIRWARALGLRDVLAVGHSAGGADPLLAAALEPELFAGVVAIEPPLVDLTAARDPSAELPESEVAGLAKVRARQSVFESRQAAFDKFRSSRMASWREDVLRDFVEAGLEELEDGSVRLRCSPEIEAAILEPVSRVLFNRYRSRGSVDAFERLPDIRCPVLMVTGGGLRPILHQRAKVATQVISGARAVNIPEASHYVPQELPEALLEAVAEFDTARAG